MVRIIHTKYYGIYVQEEDGFWWIVDDNGGELYFGIVRPTILDVDEYRNRIWR